jgi:hypothetical protein
MQVILLDQSGHRVDGVVLAAGSDRMRLAAANRLDTIELNLVEDRWLSESGEPIEIEALVPIPETAFAQFCSAVQPRTCAVGRAFPAA